MKKYGSDRSHREPIPQPKRQQFLLLTYLVAIAILTVAAPSATTEAVNAKEIILPFIIAVTVCVIHLFYTSEANWFRIDTLFLLSFMIVNFQWPAMLLFDNIMPGYDEAYGADIDLVWRFEAYANFASWVSALGLAAWAAGYSFVRDRRPRVASHSPGLSRWPAVRVLGLPANRILAFGLLVLFVMLAGEDYLAGAANREVQENLYGTISGLGAYVHLVLYTAMFVLIGTEFFSLIGRRRSGEVVGLSSFTRNFGFLLAAAYVAVFYFAGERGEMIRVLVLFGILYGMHFRALRFWEFLSLIAIGSLIFTIMGYTRIHGFTEVDGFLANIINPWTATVNLANSSVCLFVAIELVGLRGAYYWGQLFVGEIVSVVPLMQSTISSTFGVSIVDLSSAYTFAVYLYGPNPTNGAGTSIVADTYANFGPVGVVVALFLYGVVCKTMTSILREASSLRSFAAAAAFGSLAFYAGRSSLFIQLQPAVWGFAFAYACYGSRPISPRLAANSPRMRTELS